VLAYVIDRIRRHWPKVRILMRGDGHYSASEVLDLLRKSPRDSMQGLARNKTLDGLAAHLRPLCNRARHVMRPCANSLLSRQLQARGQRHALVALPPP
jgi:hypothetical protein